MLAQAANERHCRGLMSKAGMLSTPLKCSADKLTDTTSKLQALKEKLLDADFKLADLASELLDLQIWTREIHLLIT